MNKISTKLMLAVLMSMVVCSCSKNATDSDFRIESVFGEAKEVSYIIAHYKAKYAKAKISNPYGVTGDWLVYPTGDILGLGESSEYKIGDMKWEKIYGPKVRGVSYQPILLYRESGETTYLLVNRSVDVLTGNAIE
ncbi:MAG: hypothetical protein H7A51_13700 [Akkermansiaceae bacterium]|nr:hypothetical protein [Akkermansiaceae bacterium]